MMDTSKWSRHLRQPQLPWSDHLFSRWPKRMVAALVFLLLISPASALNPRFSLAQYQHTTWTEREGAPADVMGIAQTPDGYLWLSSPKGLSRFDGTAFERVRSLAGSSLERDAISTIFNGPQGEMLLAFRGTGGSAVYAGGRLVRLPKCQLTPAAIAVEGVTWLLCNGRPVRLVNDHTEPLSDDWNYPDGATTSLHVDRNGAIWASTRELLLVLPKGSRRFISYPKNPSDVEALAPDGSLWTANAAGLSVTSSEKSVPATTVMALPQAFDLLRFDRDGGLWAAGSSGLYHFGDLRSLTSPWLQPPTRSDIMTRQSGLSSNTMNTIFEDRQGSIWLGTPLGLERFRDNLLLPIKLPSGSLVSNIAAGENGVIWAANFQGKLMRVSDTEIREFSEVGPGITAVSRDRAGIIWVATANGKLWKIQDDKISAGPDVPVDIRGSAITSVTTDTKGSLWVGTVINGVVGHYVDGKWTTPGGDGLPDRWNSRNLLADSNGRLWASRRFQVIVLDNGQAREFSSDKGLSVGGVAVLSEHGSRIWVGGEAGVAYFDGAQFKALRIASGEFADVVGVLQVANGDLWIHQYDAAIRIRAAELEKLKDNPELKLQSERFDFWDGLYGTCPVSAARSNIVEATDGKIWLSTSEGFMVFDPNESRTMAAVPRVEIQKMLVDGALHDLSAPLALQRQTKNVRFVYSAASPARAERLQFKYRLDGVDVEWNEAGGRRATTYNNLASGDYTFHVAVSDESGAWPGSETMLNFHVEPRWFDSPPIRAGYVMLGLLALWLLWRWQLRRTTSRVRWQMRMQQAERERIARDLHDTLLQGVHGLTWRIQTIANTILRDDPVRGKLELALDTAEHLLIESRKRVQILREGGRDPVLLSEALRDMLVGAAATHPCAYEFVIEGIEVPVKAIVEIDISNIVREAFVNAVTHAQPATIRVRLMYARWGITVRVSDDGVGIDQRMARRGRQGHWGIAGMRERARELGGAIHVRPLPGRGTEVVLRLRARKAFVHAARGNSLNRILTRAWNALRK